MSDKSGARAAILTRIVQGRNGDAESATSVTTHDRLLRCIACDYGTHALILETLIEALIRKGVLTEDEFEDLLDEIDARDGRIDGTLVRQTYLGEGI